MCCECVIHPQLVCIGVMGFDCIKGGVKRVNPNYKVACLVILHINPPDLRKPGHLVSRAAEICTCLCHQSLVFAY